jgi:hypothetical protein
MILVAIGAADIGPHGARVAVTGLIHDPVDVGAALGRARDETGTKAVAGEVLDLKASRGGVALHDQRNALVGRGLGLDLPAPADAKEDRSLGYTGRLDPCAQGRDGLEAAAVRDGDGLPPGRLWTGGQSGRRRSR